MKSQTPTFTIEPDSFEPEFEACFRAVDSVARELGIDYVVVGATARDLVMQSVLKAEVERATKDIDYSININSWDDFDRFKTELSNRGFKQSEKLTQRLSFPISNENDIPIDIVPFGAIANELGNIAWPPDQSFRMSVLGFAEVMQSRWSIQIAEDLTLPVISPAGLCLLKLVAWIDRDQTKRAKDAQDVVYVLNHYDKVPGMFDAVYDEGIMERHEFDQPKAIADKLAQDVVSICSASTYEFICQGLFEADAQLEAFVNDIGYKDETNIQYYFDLMLVFKDAYLSVKPGNKLK